MLSYKFKKEISAEFGWDRKTLYNRMRSCGLKIQRGALSPAQQKEIYECLGYPLGIDEELFAKVKVPKSKKKEKAEK